MTEQGPQAPPAAVTATVPGLGPLPWGCVSDLSELTALGGQTRYRYEHPDPGILETFSNPRPQGGWAVGLECMEFTSLCPMTGQPDFGRLHVHYVPLLRCVETKSLKLYLGAYRNHGAFHEDCVNRIADDLVEACAPAWLRVFGDFVPRGGISIRPIAVRVAPGLDDAEVARCEALVAAHDAVSATWVARR